MDVIQKHEKKFQPKNTFIKRAPGDPGGGTVYFSQIFGVCFRSKTLRRGVKTRVQSGSQIGKMSKSGEMF